VQKHPIINNISITLYATMSHCHTFDQKTATQCR